MMSTGTTVSNASCGSTSSSNAPVTAPTTVTAPNFSSSRR
jgi:hypothetical protein